MRHLFSYCLSTDFVYLITRVFPTSLLLRLGRQAKNASWHIPSLALSASGDLERSGRPRSAQAMVARVWWRGIELTWSWGGGRGKRDSVRTLQKGKPRAYVTSVSAGRRGGGGAPNISSAYQLVGRGGEVGECTCGRGRAGRATRSGGGGAQVTRR